MGVFTGGTVVMILAMPDRRQCQKFSGGLIAVVKMYERKYEAVLQ
jgi:hypothetical protein